MKLTDQQQAFVDAALDDKAGHLCLRARAGTGKTSTILAAVHAILGDGFSPHEINVCAFNKAVQVEIANKLKANDLDWRQASAVTTHSMGFSLVRKAYPGVALDNSKVRKLIFAESGPEFRRVNAIAELVHLAKLEGFGCFEDVEIGDTENWYGMAEHYGVDDDDIDNIVTAAQYIYEKSLEQTNVIDFDDMVLLPLLHDLPATYRKDLVFLDEAQDTSRARRELVKKFLKPKGRMIIVGDDRQAIMGFAGASANALDELVTDMGATVLPLTTTWRCPKSVVALAQEFVPDIEAAEHAADGTIEHRRDFPDELRPTDAILCRNTAPLVKQAYALIRDGVACKVEGRDIGTGLLKALDKWKDVTLIGPFLDRLDRWEASAVASAEARDDGGRVGEIRDRAETLRVVCCAVSERGHKDLASVRDFVGGLFADDVKSKNMLTLATMHRSKGREWRRGVPA